MSRDSEPSINVLIFTRYYLPGFKAGGPIRSISNLVNLMGADVNFYVVCLDRDLGDLVSYKVKDYSGWNQVGLGRVKYISANELGVNYIKKILQEVQPKFVYLNSFFDFKFSILPLIVCKYFFIFPVLLAPRGEFSCGALQIKKLKKIVYLNFSKIFNVYDAVFWHASSPQENIRINHFFKPKKKIFTISNVPICGFLDMERKNSKIPGVINIAMIARVTKMKNTARAIKMVNQICVGVVNFDLWGPIEDEELWGECQEIMKQSPSNVTICYRGQIQHKEMRATITEYDVILMPTLGENFGHSIIEALSCGVPVVISDQTPWRGLLSENAGADLDLSNETKFTEILIKYLWMNQDDMNAVAKSCRNYLQSRLNMNDIYKEYKGMINEVS